MTRLIKRLLSKKEYTSVTERMLLRQCMMTALLLLTGVVTMTVSTWALFTAEVPLGTYEAKLATYGIEVGRKDEGDTTYKNVDLEEEDGAVYVETGTTSTFKITAVGTASTGYCIVSIDGNDYITDQIEPGKSLVFKVRVRGEETADETDTENVEILTATDTDAYEIYEDEAEFIAVAFFPQWGDYKKMNSNVSVMALDDELEEDEEEDDYMIINGETIICGEILEAEIRSSAAGNSGLEGSNPVSSNEASVPKPVTGTDSNASNGQEGL